MRIYTLEELRGLAQIVVSRKLETECWLWPYAKFPKGHGMVRHNDQTWRVHKLIMKFIHGPCPEGLFDLHKCEHPNCFNPEHLYRGTRSDNVRDAVKDGTHNSLRKVNHCPSGHLLEGENAYEFKVKGKIFIRCKECKKKQWTQTNMRRRKNVVRI